LVLSPIPDGKLLHLLRLPRVVSLQPLFGIAYTASVSAVVALAPMLGVGMTFTALRGRLASRLVGF